MQIPSFIKLSEVYAKYYLHKNITEPGNWSGINFGQPQASPIRTLNITHSVTESNCSLFRISDN